jgi:F420-dependent oxidoreductase-like protein
MGYIAALTETVEIGAAILPIFTRTPTLIAMTAAGWTRCPTAGFTWAWRIRSPGNRGIPRRRLHQPAGSTREIVEICRTVWKREAPLTHEGKNYTIPLPAGEGTGLGRALKIIAHPVRSAIPIWVASLGEKNVAMTAEVADGWLPILFIPERAHDVWGASLAAGAAKRSAQLGELMISAGGLLAIGEGDEVTDLRNLQRSMIALYVGGMGAKGKNFYNELAIRYGFEKEAAIIQDLYLAGKKREAEAAVPEEFIELTTLCGPKSYVADRIAAFKQAGVTHLEIHPVALGEQTVASVIGTLREMV